MSARAQVLLVTLALAATSCGGFGEYGDNELLGFLTERECFDPGCDLLRGMAVGTSSAIRITDPNCTVVGDFTAEASGALVVRSVGATENDSGQCSAYVVVEAVSEGRATLRATSPAGNSDSYQLFAAVATTMTIPERDRGWAGRADTEGVALSVGDFWWGEVRLTDAERRPLMHDYSQVWTSASPDILAPFGPPLTDAAFEARAPGETTVTVSYLGLSATVPVVVSP